MTFELTQLAKQAMPSDLAPVAALRQAMGLTTKPTLEELFHDTKNKFIYSESLYLLSAEKVTFELTQLAKQAVPSDLAPVAALRQAMGLTTGPTLEEPPAETDEEGEKGDIQEVAPPETATPMEQSTDNVCI